MTLMIEPERVKAMICDALKAGNEGHPVEGHPMRLHIVDGSDAYLIRDVRVPNIPCITCEYGVLENGALVWNPCEQGVMFEEIRPFLTGLKVCPSGTLKEAGDA